MKFVLDWYGSACKQLADSVEQTHSHEPATVVAVSRFSLWFYVSYKAA
jgi:hypothetical protein